MDPESRGFTVDRGNPSLNLTKKGVVLFCTSTACSSVLAVPLLMIPLMHLLVHVEVAHSCSVPVRFYARLVPVFQVATEVTVTSISTVRCGNRKFVQHRPLALDCT